MSSRSLGLTTRLPRRLFTAVAGVALAAAAISCTDSAGGGSDPTQDRGAPRITLRSLGAPHDSALAIAADLSDNLGIKSLSLRVSGGVTLAYDTVFTTNTTQMSLAFAFDVPSSVPPGTPILVVGTVFDGAGNSTRSDTLRLQAGNAGPAQVVIVNPTAQTIAVIGRTISISISGKSPLKVRALGFQTSGVLTTADSSVFASPLLDSLSILDTLLIPNSVQPGTLTLTPFLVDSIGVRTLGPSVTINVQTSGTTSTTPRVNMFHTPRLEVNDTLRVTGDDPNGISYLGYTIHTLAGALVVRDSFAFSGNGANEERTFRLNLPITTFPTTLLVRAFGRNTNGVTDSARLGTGQVRVDTVTIVAGVTRPLPFGGVIADALYHPRNDRLYLTNIELNRVEVFAFSDSSFKTPIPVGSRPWGIAAWPRNRDGTMGDTLLVANSGGTNISYVDVSAGAGTGVERWRYPLPNLIAYRVTSTLSQTGQIIRQRTVFDFSDRPQFLAATCRGPASGVAPCGDVVVVYSTTPTPGQSLPFPNRGTVRWENLTNNTSHFFFEQALGQDAGRADTLEVERYPAQGVGTFATLVPFLEMRTNGTDTLFRSFVVRVDQLAFRDTTFTRGSGNFRRAVNGEGGPVLGSRAVLFDVTGDLPESGVFPSTGVPFNWSNVIDEGISRPIDVSDFIANTFARVRGVGINFDGELSAVRGDSTYILDRTLRLQGLLQTSGGNPGFDFHPLNDGLNDPSASWRQERLAFAASSTPVIEIYDTHCYQRISSVPIRDPIIGPIKASFRSAGGGELVLVGATSRGVVIVALPTNVATTTCQR